jgi:hypothetical protein
MTIATFVEDETKETASVVYEAVLRGISDPCD